eukprot:11186505-Lingulodinium_polyedra.AAC.1
MARAGGVGKTSLLTTLLAGGSTARTRGVIISMPRLRTMPRLLTVPRLRTVPTPRTIALARRTLALPSFAGAP